MYSHNKDPQMVFHFMDQYQMSSQQDLVINFNYEWKSIAPDTWFFFLNFTSGTVLAVYGMNTILIHIL